MKDLSMPFYFPILYSFNDCANHTLPGQVVIKNVILWNIMIEDKYASREMFNEYLRILGVENVGETEYS